MSLILISFSFPHFYLLVSAFFLYSTEFIVSDSAVSIEQILFYKSSLDDVDFPVDEK